MIFTFIGEEPLSRMMNEVAKDDNIIFLGRVKNTDLPIHYKGVDVVVMPSLYEEGITKALKEINPEKLSKNCRPYAERMFSSGNALVIEKAYKG